MSNERSEDPPPPVELGRIRAGQRLEVRHAASGALLVRRLELALGPWQRLRGLLGQAGLEPGQGLLLRPCQGVHTLFMRFAIDALFLDHAGRVVDLRAPLRPWRATSMVSRALAVLELPAGQAAATGTARGDRLIFCEV